MNKQSFLNKIATKAPKVDNWGLPDDERYPLDTVEHIKTAEERFPDRTVDVDIRLELARNMSKRASELGVKISEKIANIAGDSLNPDWDSLIALRKADSAHMRDPELDLLRDLAHEATSVDDLSKVASVLQTFDRETMLDGIVPDAAESVFGAPVSPFAMTMPSSTYNQEKLAGLDGVISEENLNHLKGGGDIAELPWTVREVVGSFLRGT